MNKALKKYGKVSFKSIVPKRLKLTRVRRVMAFTQVAAVGYSNLRVLLSTNYENKALKAMAVAKHVLQTQEAMLKALTHTK